MATALVIEEERGTFTGHYHRHNGYYAGEFFTRPAALRSLAAVIPMTRQVAASVQPESIATRSWAA